PHHHHAKDHGPWTLTQPTPGHFIWTSPTGHTHHLTPEPLHEPQPTPPPTPPAQPDDPPPF
ncbi:MAG: HNH endonuclease, partial [Pseudonocardiaceae bacterium]|nr:HNH endonuclease [Pseudonocardiaceae bacterium]